MYYIHLQIYTLYHILHIYAVYTYIYNIPKRELKLPHFIFLCILNEILDEHVYNIASPRRKGERR
jgi:hypothetical protein